VAEYIRRAAVIGITWPIPEGLDETALERKLFAPAATTRRGRSRCRNGDMSTPSCAGAA
jgi:hypothetical protein